ELAQLDRAAIAADPARRAALVADLFGAFTDDVLRRSLFYQVLDRHRPDAVVDCLNTATAFAYQNVYQSIQELLVAARQGGVTAELAERHVLTLPLPQLIRHLQIATEAFQRTGVGMYVKIGTSGTGGMGFNIPYTHSEERPSRMLLTKSALAGAHSLLLFLLARTPGAPATKEIKPTAVVGWREICYGPIKRAGRALRRVDCPQPLPLARAFAPGARGWRDTGEPIVSVYADTGENGFFAPWSRSCRGGPPGTMSWRRWTARRPAPPIGPAWCGPRRSPSWRSSSASTRCAPSRSSFWGRHGSPKGCMRRRFSRSWFPRSRRWRRLRPRTSRGGPPP
ncbi:MAG: hypothetical protein HYY94_00505, partial [Gemmatimonadetes bacterium]|nr:hypothetical protein [Gemmatimonadota bacterium]